MSQSPPISEQPTFPFAPTVAEEAGRPEAGLPHLPGYLIEAELGRGGMGVVYQARQVALGRVVALKMILAGDYASPEARARFLAEAEAIARVQHPHIVQIYEFGEHQGKPYFTLELVPGGSLERRLSGTPLPPRQAAVLVEKLAQALQAAHQAGIVHRDLKPANVLLGEDGSPRVTDFGLAKKLDAAAHTATGAVLGTPSYMAPEQAAGMGKDVGPAADVYALGAILYECLTGRPPFKAASPVETVMQVVSDDPVPPRQLQPGLPRDLETICLKCLRKEPARRYLSAAALAADLHHFLEGRPILARPVSRVERGWRWCRRNPVVAGLAGSLAGVLVAGLVTVTLLYFQSDARRRQADFERERAEGLQAEALRHLEDAGRQRDEATRQKERAEASYRLARKALDKVVKLRDDPRLRTGPLEDLQRQIAQAETAFYQEFLDLRGDDPAFQAERASACDRLSMVLYLQGNMKDALRFARQAVAISRRLHEQAPTDPTHARLLAANLSQFALVCTKLGQLDEMERSFRRAADLHLEVLKRAPGSADARDAAATCLQNLGVGRRNAGQLDRAEKVFLEALALCEKPKTPLTRAQETNRRFRTALIWGNLTELYTGMKRLDDALAASGKSIALWQELSRQDPADAMYRLNLAGCHNNLGNIYRDTDRNALARASWEKAITLYDALVGEHPTQRQYAHALAMVHDNLGMLHLDLDRLARARPHLDQALATWTRLHAEDPTVIEYISDLGCVQRNLGNLAWKSGNEEEALRWYARAIGTLETSPDRDRDGTKSCSWLRNASIRRASLLAHRGRFAEAVRHWDRAVTLERGSRAETRLRRADSLARAGLRDRAVREAEFLAGLPGAPRQALYQLARVLALCLPADQDRTLSAEQRKQQAGRLARLAVSWLRRSGSGNASDLEHWEKDSDLASLRARPEFQKLKAELLGKR